MIAFWFALVLTAYRAYRLVGYDVFPPVKGPRDRFEAWVRRNHGDDWADGIGCPWCMGSWTTIIVVSIAWRWTPMPMPLLWYTSVACAVGLVGTALDKD